jgi:hypothetical protein
VVRQNMHGAIDIIDTTDIVHYVRCTYRIHVGGGRGTQSPYSKYSCIIFPPVDTVGNGPKGIQRQQYLYMYKWHRARITSVRQKTTAGSCKWARTGQILRRLSWSWPLLSSSRHKSWPYILVTIFGIVRHRDGGGVPLNAAAQIVHHQS